MVQAKDSIAGFFGVWDIGIREGVMDGDSRKFVRVLKDGESFIERRR
jgi:hypothetical protein